MPSTTSCGRSLIEPCHESPRHCSHSVYSRPRYGLLIGRSSSGQVTLLIVSSRQCRSRQPVRTPDATSPHVSRRSAPPSSASRHRPTHTPAGRTSRQDSTHPLTNTAAFRGRIAAAGSGSTGRPRPPTSRPRHAPAHRTDIGGVSLQPTSAAHRAAQRVGPGAAAVPWPTGTGTAINSTDADADAATPSAHHPPPGWPSPTAQRGGEPAGFSTRCRVRTASPADTTVAASRPAGPSGLTEQRRHEQQHRPVPQVPRVRHPADRPHRRLAQQATGTQLPVSHNPRR